MGYKTILVNGFTIQRWNSHSANGGVELVQVLKRKGKFFKRYVGSNGRHTSPSEATLVSLKDVNNLIDCAIQRAFNEVNNGRSTIKAFYALERELSEFMGDYPNALTA